MENTIFWIIIAIVLFDFIFEKVLDYLNFSHLKETIPAELKGIYDADAYSEFTTIRKGKFTLLIGHQQFLIHPYLAHAFYGRLWLA